MTALNADITHYLVRVDFGRLGLGWVDTDCASEAEVAQDIADGQFGKVVKVASFNLAENHSQDISEDIARAVASLPVWDRDNFPCSDVQDFIEQCGGMRLGDEVREVA